MNNISFQGRTNLIFNDSFYDNIIKNTSRRAFTNINLSGNNCYKIHNSRYSVYDPNEIETTGVLLVGERGGMFFHNAQNKLYEILDTIDNLKQSTKNKLTAWIIGGKSGEKTTKDVNDIAKVLCDRQDIDTSIIAGHNSKAPNLTFHLTVDKLDLSMSTPVCNRNKPVDKSLESYFDIVELNNTEIS